MNKFRFYSLTKATSSVLHGNNFISSSPLVTTTRTSMRSQVCSLQEEEKSEGKPMTICGWLVSRRRLGEHLMFFPIRDRFGVIQCSVIRDNNPELFERLCDLIRKGQLNPESSLRVKGKLQHRPEKDIKNGEQPNGDVEILVDEVEILSSSPASLPLDMGERLSSVKSNEETRLQYRFLEMRKKERIQTIITRSNVTWLVRSFFLERQFLEVETPVLFKSTPEGAREFVVPTRSPGLYYSLVQSPQQYKQLLMLGGIDRYFQIAKCFRDEDLASDKQPEFTQIDMEMSFVKQSDVMQIMEDLIKTLWSKFRNYEFKDPIPTMTFQDAIDKFGIDKPDLRFQVPILRLADGDKVVEAVKVPATFSAYDHHVELPKKVIKRILNIPKTMMNPLQKVLYSGLWEGQQNMPFPTHQLERGRHYVISERTNNFHGSMTISGYVVRQITSSALTLSQDLAKIAAKKFEFLWIIDFPLFKRSDINFSTLESVHHPFTAPNERFIDPQTGLLNICDNDLLSIVAQHYDLVLNGTELGGGSVRIHDVRLQKQVFQDILCTKDDVFRHLLMAFQYGCPPHGGMAIGLDRLLTFLCDDCSSIRDVIPFPKSSQGKDLMIGSPSKISPEQTLIYNQNTQ